MDIAGSLQRTGVEMDVAAVVRGFRDGYTGSDSLLTQTEVGELVQAFQVQARTAMQKKQQEDAEQALAAGAAFLEENAGGEGVVITASGLQYTIITAGDGAKPKPEDTVRVHYHGTLVDGSVFDSSVDRGQPAVFQVQRVIPGWTEGLQLMNVGSKYRFFIPGDLAYGARSPNPKIPPNSVLIFEVELMGIE
jgi:FKBP-type peptidyl-prolyl cis-trans isomerase